MGTRTVEGNAHAPGQLMLPATVLARLGPRELGRSASQPGISSKHVSLDKTLALCQENWEHFLSQGFGGRAVPTLNPWD